MMMPRLTPALSTLLFAAALAACGCGPKKSAQPMANGGAGGLGVTTDDVGTSDLSKLGTACGDGDRCEGGTSCVKYYGIAGPSGPEFASCEVACPSGKGCPSGTACITIADGPGAVCRMPAADTVEETPTAE